jgi:multidrug efflux system membrane fusion protein
MAEQEHHPSSIDSGTRAAPPGADAGTAPRTRARSRRRIAAVIVLVIALAALLWWRPWAGSSSSGGGSAVTAHRTGGGRRDAMANMPQPVHVAAATTGEMPIVLTALGTVTPLATVTVKTQLSGTLQSIAFREGQLVKAGDVLAQIDPRPYQISLENAEGALAKDSALLQTARLDLKRYQALLAQDSIARQQVDTQASLVKQYEGQVQSDRATIDTYKLDLVYARITAPVAGRVGLRQVDPGNYVTPSDANGIVVITQLQPISVVFTTSEDNLPAILTRLHSGAKLSTTAYDRNNTVALETGYLDTVDNQIDTATGTVKLRALFPNAGQMLFPNQFVNARLLIDTLHDAVIVPSSAVLNGANGPFVYVVKPDDTVTVRQVKVGPIDAERTSIASGLAVGERVVIDGSDRLKEGAKITVAPDAAAVMHGASGSHAGGAHGAGASGASGASGVHGHRHKPASSGDSTQ